MRALVLLGLAAIAVAAIVAAFIHASGVRCVPWNAYGAAPVMLSGKEGTQKDPAQSADYAAASRETSAPAPADIEALADTNEKVCTSAIATLGIRIVGVALAVTALMLWFVRRTVVPH